MILPNPDWLVPNVDELVEPNKLPPDGGLDNEPNIGVVDPKPPTFWLKPVLGVLLIKFCVCPNGEAAFVLLLPNPKS